jgi:hypothetical protein
MLHSCLSVQHVPLACHRPPEQKDNRRSPTAGECDGLGVMPRITAAAGWARDELLNLPPAPYAPRTPVALVAGTDGADMLHKKRLEKVPGFSEKT